MLKCFTDLKATRGIVIYWYEMYTYHFKFLLIENKKTYSLNLFISFIAYKIYKYNIFVKLNLSKRRKQIYYEVLKMLLFYNFQWGYAINTNFFFTICLQTVKKMYILKIINLSVTLRKRSLVALSTEDCLHFLCCDDSSGLLYNINRSY